MTNQKRKGGTKHASDVEEVKKTAECGGKELSYLNYAALAKQRREFIINGAVTDTLKKQNNRNSGIKEATR